MPKSLLLCDCLGSQSIDAKALEDATTLPCSQVFTNLCGTQSAEAAKAMQSGDVIIGCAQEQTFFEALADELDVSLPACLDLRDRAGWSEDTAPKTPKLAALIAEASLPSSPPKMLDLISEGMCLIIGKKDVAIPAAEQLCDHLSVTVLLPPNSEPENNRRFDIVSGVLKSAQGAFPNFEVRIDQFQDLIRGGRGTPEFGPIQGSGASNCDIILDLSGNPPLFPAPEKRDGYLRADPKHLPSIAAAVMDASHMVGTFEKPLYVRVTEPLCAHSRASQIGCSKCLDICPTGAIAPAGDHVSVDPMICAGCGACSSLCPSGAISYDAPPPVNSFKRVETLATAYLGAGGSAPRLLVHDASFGLELIQSAARFERGLPADVIPLEVSALASFGHAEILAALASGFAAVDILATPRTETVPLIFEVSLANALSAPECARLLELNDPADLCEHLYNVRLKAGKVEPILPLGSRRQVARISAKTLNPDSNILSLPDAAPYGAVAVNTEACTLCLSCVSLCPSGALGDNPDRPQLRFQEDACLQCGLCSKICPENAIDLIPQLNLTDAALSQVVLHEEEPFACVECGELFGVKSTIEKITEKLAGKHSMFASGDAARMIQMCDNCRVNAQAHTTDSPFASKERPPVRRSEDYFSKRKDH